LESPVRRKDIHRPTPPWLALENALDRMPDPATMTPEENRRAIAILDKVSAAATRRMVALHVRVWMDEYRASLSNDGSRRT
jgi:hypothetical protein